LKRKRTWKKKSSNHHQVKKDLRSRTSHKKCLEDEKRRKGKGREGSPERKGGEPRLAMAAGRGNGRESFGWGDCGRKRRVKGRKRPSRLWGGARQGRSVALRHHQRFHKLESIARQEKPGGEKRKKRGGGESLKNVSRGCF